MDQFWTDFGSILGAFWRSRGGKRGGKGRNNTDHIFGAILELFWSHIGDILELFGVHFGAILGQFWIIWGQFEVVGDNLGAMLLLGTVYGAMLVSLDHVYTLFVSFLLYF